MATETGHIQFVEGSVPSTPATGKWRLYTKTTGLFIVDDAGTEYGPLAADGASAHIADAADAHDASAISIVDSGTFFTGTDVEAALQEIGAGAGGASNLSSARYVRSSGDYTLTGVGSTSFANVDNTNLSLTITTGARPVLVVVQATGSVNNVAGAIGLDIELDGSRLGGSTGGLVFVQVPVSGETMNMSFSYITADLTAASHTFKLQWNQANTSHTATLRGSDPTMLFAVAELYA